MSKASSEDVNPYREKQSYFEMRAQQMLGNEQIVIKKSNITSPIKQELSEASPVI